MNYAVKLALSLIKIMLQNNLVFHCFRTCVNFMRKYFRVGEDKDEYYK